MRSVVSLQSQHAFQQVIEKLRGFEDRGTTIPTTFTRDLSAGWHLKACRHREHTITLAPLLLQGLQLLASKHGCSLFIAVVSTFHVWQYRLTGKRKVSIMTSNSWRDALSERLIGSFLTDMILVANIDNADDGTAATTANAKSADGARQPTSGNGGDDSHCRCSFVELVKQTQQCHRFMAENTVDAPLATWNSIFPDSDSLPYAILLNFVSKEWNTEFALEGATVEEVDELDDEDDEVGAAESELDIEFEEETGEMTWTYNTSLYDKPAVQAIAAAFVEVAKHCIEQPEQPLAATPAKFTEWMATDIPPPSLVGESIRSWQNSMRSLMQQNR